MARDILLRAWFDFRAIHKIFPSKSPPPKTSPPQPPIKNFSPQTTCKTGSSHSSRIQKNGMACFQQGPRMQGTKTWWANLLQNRVASKGQDNHKRGSPRRSNSKAQKIQNLPPHPRSKLSQITSPPPPPKSPRPHPPPLKTHKPPPPPPPCSQFSPQPPPP